MRSAIHSFLIILINAIANEGETFLFSRAENHVNDHYINIFSVLAGSDYPTIKNRVVVDHTGTDDGNGTWKCFKDIRMVSCPHILIARHCLQKYINADPSATDLNANSDDILRGDPSFT